jgi:hypothetical protein
VGTRRFAEGISTWVRRMGMKKVRSSYEKPVLTKHANLRDITFECPNWQCSVTVPPPPAP